MGNDTVVLTTGGRSEDFMKKLLNFQNIVLFRWAIFQVIQFNNAGKKYQKSICGWIYWETC